MKRRTPTKPTWDFLRAELVIEQKRGRPGLQPITGADDVRKVVRAVYPTAAEAPQESIILICLDVRNVPIGVARVALGSLSSAPFNPASAARLALALPTSAVILVHNHPSGDLTPSPDDIELTRYWVKTMCLLGMRPLDHVILGDERAVSLRATRNELFVCPGAQFGAIAALALRSGRPGAR